jgi:hypothetical protein
MNTKVSLKIFLVFTHDIGNWTYIDYCLKTGRVSMQKNAN